MDELFKTLRHFIARDFVFVIGGGVMIATFLYASIACQDQNLPGFFGSFLEGRGTSSPTPSKTA